MEKIIQWQDAPDLLTIYEAAKLLRVGKNHMYSLAKAPGFPKIILGERIGIRIPKEAFKKWIEEQIA